MANCSAPSGGDSKKPQVVFVLGGPGTGKGTQCYNVTQRCSGWGHVSAGDCLREEKENPNSPNGKLIREILEAGKLVPVEITVNLLRNAMLAAREKGTTKFLVDGFPRNEDNVQGWDKVIGDSMDIRGVLFFDLALEEMERRVLKRGENSGRTDDTAEVIRKRISTHIESSVPIVAMYRQKNMLVTIDGAPPQEEVYSAVLKAIQAWEKEMP